MSLFRSRHDQLLLLDNMAVLGRLARDIPERPPDCWLLRPHNVLQLLSLTSCLCCGCLWLQGTCHLSSLTSRSYRQTEREELTSPCVCAYSRSAKGAKDPESQSHSHSQISPTSNRSNPTAGGSFLASLSPNFFSSSTSNLHAAPPTFATAQREHRMSDFANYRRDLAVLDPAGSRAPQIQHNPPSTAASFMQQVAPWMTGGGAGAGTGTTPGSSNGHNGGIHSHSPIPTAGNGAVLTTTFYNDDSDNLSSASQMSPGFRSASVGALMRPTQNPPGSDSPDAAYFNDERRPSVASITTTASSQASKSSGHRGGLRKLQGFFGEEYPGRDSSETSLPPSYAGKESRSHSYSHTPRPHRDRNHSNATDHTRDASPASSRPRTPVPAPEVVPFLYQEAEVRLQFLIISAFRPAHGSAPSRPANLISPDPFVISVLRTWSLLRTRFTATLHPHHLCSSSSCSCSCSRSRSNLQTCPRLSTSSSSTFRLIPLTLLPIGHRAIR